MEPSSNSAGGRPGRAPGADRFIVVFDRAVVGALAVGLALYVMPFWREGRLRVAFWLTLVATVLHVYTSHRRGADDQSPAPPTDGPGAAG